MMKPYEGKPLDADEYLLKMRTNRDESISGFLTKLTKKGEIPFTCGMGMLSGKVVVI